MYKRYSTSDIEEHHFAFPLDGKILGTLSSPNTCMLDENTWVHPLARDKHELRMWIAARFVGVVVLYLHGCIEAERFICFPHVKAKIYTRPEIEDFSRRWREAAWVVYFVNSGKEISSSRMQFMGLYDNKQLIPFVENTYVSHGIVCRIIILDENILIDKSTNYIFLIFVMTGLGPHITSLTS